MQMQHRNPEAWCVSKLIMQYFFFSLSFYVSLLFNFEYLFHGKSLPEGDCM